MKAVVGIQARINSKRLPGKVLFKLGDKTIIERIYNTAAAVAETYVLTGSLGENHSLVEYCQEKKIPLFIGDDDNVLSRFSCLQKKTRAKIIVRLTGDNPLVQSSAIEGVINSLMANRQMDYVSNCVFQDVPMGLNVEAMTSVALQKIQRNPDHNDCEHVTAKFKIRSTEYNVQHLHALANQHWPSLRLTIDEEADFLFLTSLYEKIGEEMWNIPFLIDYLKGNQNYITNALVRQKVLND